MNKQTFKTIAASIFTLTMSACSDPRNAIEGTPESLAKCSVATEEIQKASVILGAYYDQLCTASPQDYERLSDRLTGVQLDAVMSIHRQLGLYVEVMQRQPTTDAARMADYQVSRHQGFMANLPRLRQSWLGARQRMSAP